MTVWVTGATGMLGSAVCKVLRDRKIPVLGSSHKDLDICQVQACEEMLNSEQISHIVNCAAYTAVDVSEEHPEFAERGNAEGPRILAELAKKYGARIIHISTDYVFDGKQRKPYLESEQTLPLSSYGRSKARGETAVLEASSKNCVLRTSALFGPGGKNFVQTMLKLMEEQEVIEVVNDQVSRPSYSMDLAAIIPELLEQEGIFHFANSGEVCWYTFALTIRELAESLGWKFRVQEIRPVKSCQFPRPAKRPKYSVLSTEKLEKVTGKAPRSWKAALKEYLESRAL